MAKRLFDLVFAAVGLLLLAPLLLLISVWIRVDSPGPILFRQERVGRHGRTFQIHKFRTMRVDAPQRGPQITIGADPRITRIGQLLRRSKLDELPQLWDVLRGAMSLVGPRPEVPRYVALYPEPMRSVVLSVRPGITDLASVRFADEAALLATVADPEAFYASVVLPQKLSMAAEYVQNANLLLDLKIIAITVRKVWQ